jgi:hypothetical protein
VDFALLYARSGRQSPRECHLQLFWLKPKGARLALVGNAALRVDQVNAIRPARICPFRRIAKLVEHGWKLDPKFPYASPSDECPFFLRLRANKNNLVLNIALRLPNVTGMRFGNVNNQEGDTPAIPFVELIEGRNLPPERWSSVAAEYQNHGLPLA